MAQNEIELHGEFTTGLLMPGGRFGLRLRRSWESRSLEFVDAVVSATDGGAEGLEEVLENNEQMGDVFMTTLERVVRVGDVFYRQALARAVTAALDETTPIDTAEALIDRLLRLDVASLRMLFELYRPRPNPTWPEELLAPVAIVLRDLRRTGNVQMVDPALAQLEAAGFLTREWEVETSAGEAGEDPVSEAAVKFERTDWGQTAYEICLAHE